MSQSNDSAEDAQAEFMVNLMIHDDTDGTVLGYWSRCIFCGEDDYKKNKWHPRHRGA